MIDRLIRALGATRLDLTVEELADALWLARFLPEQQPAPTPAQEEPAPGEEPTPREKPASPRASTPEAAGEAPAPVPPPAPLVLPSEQRASLHGVPLRVPAAPALPDPLGLGRALRPLHRRVHSRRTQVIDEPASAEQIAETRVWLPVQRPEQVRWLDLALVVDTSTSMALWRQTVAELRDLLQFHGAFRNVRVWRLPTDSSEGELRLLAGLGTGEEPLVESLPNELSDPEGRRLVMVVSDCVSRRWHTGEVPELLELWGRTGPVVVVQMLPEHYWGRTALRNGPDVLLRAPFRGAPNAQLLVEEEDGTVQEAGTAGPVVPVVTLEQASLAAWAKLVAGGSATVQGFELRPAQTLPPTIAGTASSPSVQEILERFFATASLPARKLAGLLAAVPVSLPVMNLIRETLVPEARQEHLAEVFLGGLLREPPGQEASTDPDEKLYDFWPDVREQLLDSLPAGSARNVLLRVSDYIADRLNQPRDFRAFLVDSTKDVTPFVEQHRAFATIAAHVLQRLGGAYADLAQRLTTTLQALLPEETKAETPQEPVSPPRPDDWAIVMGIDHYQVRAGLWNSESEARAFADWLVSPEGGGLPKSQVLELHSPTSENLEGGFQQLFHDWRWQRRENAPVGRRIYLFMSGHGAESPGQEGPMLFLSDFGPERPAHVDGIHWARWFLRSGLFQEVVLLMNCSRAEEGELLEADRFPKLEDLPAVHSSSEGSFLFGFSTSPGEHAYTRPGRNPDLFMDALLKGLSGGAADKQGDITAASLWRFVALQMAEHKSEDSQVPDFRWSHETGEDFIIKPPPSRVRIHYHRIYHGLTARISNEDQVRVVTKASQSPKPLELRRGSYKLELPQIARSWPLEVSGPEASLSVDWAPSGLWVLVAGSAEPFQDKSPLAWVCEALGETLARAGHGLLIGDQVGVDQRLLRSFEKMLREAGIASSESLVQIASSRLQSVYDKAVQRADAIVLMGGSGSTYALFERARAAKKLVLPLGGVGGISENIYRQVQSTALNSGQERLLRMLEALDVIIDSPVKAAALARQVAESLQTLLERKASRRWAWLGPDTGEQLRQFANEYEQLRTHFSPGPERTSLLDDLLARIGKEKASLERLPPDALARNLEEASAGERLVLLGLLLKQVDPHYFKVVHDILAHSLTAFEQYTALGVVGLMLEQLGPKHLDVLRNTLNRLRDTDVLELTSDVSRAHQVDTFLWEIQQLLRQGPPKATPPAKPSRAPRTEYLKKPLFAWVHLADLHIGQGSEEHRRNQEFILHALNRDIERQHTLGIPQPDAILVAGDISLTADPRQYVLAERWLQELAGTVGLDSRRVFTVPGNHDVQRNTHRNENIDRLVHSLREGAEDLDEVLANKTEQGLLARRFESYLTFAEKFAPACLPQATVHLPDLSWMHRMEAHLGLRVRLVGFNTALLSSNNYDHGRLRLAQKSFDALMNPPPEVRELVLVLSHHAFNAGWFADETKVNLRLRARAHIQLSAHLHQTTTLETDAGNDLVRISAGTMHKESPAYGYNIAAVYHTPEGSLTLRVWPRVWSNTIGDFRTDTNNASPASGFKQFSLPNIRVPVPA